MVGLPRNILHGLYSMGLVAKANAARRRRQPAGAEAPLGADARDGRARAGDRRHRHGQVGDGNRVVVDTVATQGETALIKNAEAELEV